MTPYNKPRHRTRASRKRRLLDQMDADNHREWTAVTMASSEKEARARIQERYPDETAEQIEQRVAFVMKAGSKPTTAKVLEPGRIPAEVLAARKAERKAKVKANHPRRKVEELERKLANINRVARLAGNAERR